MLLVKKHANEKTSFLAGMDSYHRRLCVDELSSDIEITYFL